MAQTRDVMPVPQPTLIHRITHCANLPWILEHGVCCRATENQDPNFVNIGDRDLIARRETRAVEIHPGGHLSNYVPFYFSPHSVMLYKIHTGEVPGCTARQKEIIFLVSSIQRLQERSLTFLFTDGHASPRNTQYFSDPKDLEQLDWGTIRSKDFKKRLEDPDRSRRYQAECLVYERVPLEALLAVGCRDTTCLNIVKEKIQCVVNGIKVVVRPGWYF
jgi:ssDNA thymidine ADP-ribosyltransferase, DarT